MINGFLVFILSVAYMGVLFTLAYAGDQKPSLYTRAKHRAAIYSLCLAVYCTSWTFYGAVGTAATSGMSFLPIYLGPALVFLFGAPFIQKMVRVSKRHNSTSIADFIATRYGKSQGLAAFISLIALVGILPYIALQLKAVSMGFSILTEGTTPAPLSTPLLQDTSIYVAFAMAVFTILFGTRHLTATEHHHGLMLAIAFESAVKLIAFMAVGLFVFFLLTTAGDELIPADHFRPNLEDMLSRSPDPLTFSVYTLLSALAIFCLPRQFHVMVVENHDVEDVRTARWAFPLYLLVLSIFVLPIAAVGLVFFPNPTVNPDTYILALPLVGDQKWLALVVFIGGASAATGMVIMSSVTLSTMISNEVLVPLLLRMGWLAPDSESGVQQRLLNLRRFTIAAIIAAAYLFARFTSQTISLASIGLLSFVAVAQFAPALLGGLYWRRGSQAGAIAGMTSGFLMWAYTLLLPAILRGDSDTHPLLSGPLHITWLSPEALLGFGGLDPIVHGTLFSLAINTLTYTLVSAFTQQKVIERIQVASFYGVPERQSNYGSWAGSATVEDLTAVSDRFLGKEQTQAAFKQFSQRHSTDLPPGKTVNLAMIQHIENYLAGVIGSSSARVVLSSALKGRHMGIEDVVSIVDEASQVMRFNRELLQSAIENMRLGVSVIDRDLNLVAWNSRYLELFNYPRGFVRVGRPIADMLRHNLVKSKVAEDTITAIIEARLKLMREGTPHEYERVKPDGSVILIQGCPMPDGGFVTSFSDITAMRRTEQALKETNTYLEQRVQERTEELSRLNDRLTLARQEAERANLGKTRFLASASHDLLQPLNAARLFTSALNNLISRNNRDSEEAGLARNLDSSLASAEDILGTLLDISKLDAGAIPPRPITFCLNDIFKTLRTEFSVIAQQKGVQFRCVPCSVHVHSDPQMLRRILQNFLSNAVRYTRQGRVLLGARRIRGGVRLEVRDTGPGIPESMLMCIFEEFRRLGNDGPENRGLGLGLAIVERIARLLNVPVRVKSWPGAGSLFTVELPTVDVVVTTPAGSTTPGDGAAAAESAAIRGLSILCIDNEPAILEAMRALLAGWGYRVSLAGCRADALALFHAEAAEVILADYQLDNEENGLQVMDDIQALASRRITGVLITAANSPELKAETRKKGYHFMRKPVKPAALRALLSSLSSQ